MECQIVPNYKHVCVHDNKVKQQRKGNNAQQKQQQQQSKKNGDTAGNAKDQNEIYFLQPMFKPPKSTKDIPGTKNDDSIGFAVKAISESNTDRRGQFNHFTMSRKGASKNNGISRVEEPYLPSSFHYVSENQFHSKRNNFDDSSEKPHSATSAAARRRASFVNDSHDKNNLQIPSRERMRRASAGDVLIKNNRINNNNNNNSNNNNNTSLDIRQSNRSAHSARHRNTIDQDSSRVVSIGPDEVLLIPQLRRPSEPANSAKRRETNGKSSCQGDNNPTALPRRKSFHDWCSIQEWYLQEPRPVSPDSESNTRRNVISPSTLSRLLPNTENPDSGRGTNSISVCTEGDRMSYNFNLPNRRLVSHKDLKACSLPYSDNIGLEEAVSSDQARKVSSKNSKQTMAIKKKYETNKQTPKQVWYRTVRSILAANHLYHSVKRKNRKNASAQ